jgi:hypothetical protein
MVDQEARKRIEALEARGVQRDREIADLSGRLSRLEAMLEALRTDTSGARAHHHHHRAPPPKSAVSSTPTVGALHIEAPGARVAAAGPPPPKSAVSSAAASRPPASTSPSPAAAMLPPPPAVFPSLIVADFPALFAEFRGKRFTLVWRGFGAGHFHGRCDGHANTLTLIEDTEGNIFGGFTPVEWESGPGHLKADPSLKSFLFTLKNPHKFPARKFALKAKTKNEAICCDSSYGPHFCDIGVSDNCDANTRSFTYSFGRCYVNDTDLDGQTFFTGSGKFTAKEIEVFEITD